jgi:hypothetical protein
MTRIIRGRLIVAAVCLAAACQTSLKKDFWLAPGDYDVQLVVKKRGALTPELRQALSRLSDTALVHMRLDSVARDSIFGTYTGEIHTLGIMAGRVTPGPQAVAGSIRNGRFSLELSPDATDAGVILDGEVADGQAIGTWHTETGPTNGSFVVRRR